MLAASGNADKDRSKIRDRDKGREGERREGRGGDGGDGEEGGGSQELLQRKGAHRLVNGKSGKK